MRAGTAYHRGHATPRVKRTRPRKQVVRRHWPRAELNIRLIERLEAQINEHSIDVLIVDPFVSSHRVNEMDNGKIDMVTKEWVRLAERTNCAIELVHHTRKLNGVEASSDASRGASSLVNAARSSRVLQRLSNEELRDANVAGDGCTYFSVKRDKSNLAQGGQRETFRTVSVDLGQGDQVGVVERWKKPDAFDGLSRQDTLRVQQAVDGKELRYSSQAGDAWAGHVIADVLSLDADKDKRRVKKLIEDWLKTGVLEKEDRKLRNGRSSPFLVVGEWAHQ